MATTIYSSTSYTLGAGEDNLTLQGTANINGSGNAGVNTITGNDGNNVLNGMGGSDTLVAGAGNDVLYMDGYDFGQGGNGADTYWVSNDRNVTSDTGTDGAIDVVKSSVSFYQGSWLDSYMIQTGYSTSSGGVERIELQGSANLKASGGNGNQTLVGNSGDNLLVGDAGADTLQGGDGNDVLAGNTNNTASVDTTYDELYGGAGNDIYYVSGKDVAQDSSGNDVYYIQGANNRIYDSGGVDIVYSARSFSAGAFYYSGDDNYASGGMETIQLTGALNINAQGDGGNNTILGNSGNNLLEGFGGVDTMDGGAGNDVLNIVVPQWYVQTGATLTGGAGSDEFRFGSTYTGNHTTGAATIAITDFTQGQDWINLSRTGLNTLTTLNAQAGDTLASMLAQASNQATAAQAQALSQFTLNGDTYVVLDTSTSSSFASTDLAFKLNGAKTLTLADFGLAAPSSPTTGGAGNDVLHVTATPSNGIDYQQGATLTGNGGNDTFWIDAGYRGDHATVNPLIISDFTSGVDTIRLSIASGLYLPGQINTLAVQAGDTLSTLMARASHQTSTYTMPALSQFAWGGETYLVLDSTADPSWVGSNLAIKLAGAPTLTLADFNFA